MDVYIKTWGEGQILLTVLNLMSVMSFALHPGLAVKTKFIHFATVQKLFYYYQAKYINLR